MLILSDNEAQVLGAILQRIEFDRKTTTPPEVKKEEKKLLRKKQVAYHLAKTLGSNFLNYIKL